MIRVRLLVSYDGTDFCGWQRQGPRALPSLQQTVDEALGKFFNQPIILYASGRTDAGVHAMAQVCHFDVDVTEERLRSRDICYALKALLPPTISVRKAWIAPPEFHATLSATHKTYRYYIYNHRRINPIWRRYADWIYGPLDVDYLNAAAGHVIGRFDFKSFQTSGTPVKDTVRTIMAAEWTRKSRNLLQFSVTGQGFLKQMVRNLVGTQLMLHKYARPPEDMATILAARDRRQAGPSAPPQGLFLWRVYYPEILDKGCRPL